MLPATGGPLLNLPIARQDGVTSQISVLQYVVQRLPRGEPRVRPQLRQGRLAGVVRPGQGNRCPRTRAKGRVSPADNRGLHSV